MSVGVTQQQGRKGNRPQVPVSKHPSGFSTKTGHLSCHSKNSLRVEGGTQLSGNPGVYELTARGSNLSQRNHSRKPTTEKS
jgi:hypothetical protein